MTGGKDGGWRPYTYYHGTAGAFTFLIWSVREWLPDRAGKPMEAFRWSAAGPRGGGLGEAEKHLVVAPCGPSSLDALAVAGNRAVVLIGRGSGLRC
jgi:hypothetical protein